MHRRDLLKSLTVTLGLAGFFLCSAGASGAVTSMRELVRRHIGRTLILILSEEVTPQTLGRSYLSLYPEDADVERLWTALVGSRAPAEADRLERRLAELRRRDFEDGEIAIVDGWVLARTEARACALMVLV
jgi:hypothetical protein